MGRKKNNSRNGPPPNVRPQQKEQQQPSHSLQNETENKTAQTAAVATPIAESNIDEAKLKLTQVQQSVDAIKASLSQLHEGNTTVEAAAEKSNSDNGDTVDAHAAPPFETNTAKRKRNRNRKRNKGAAAEAATPTSDSNDDTKLNVPLEQANIAETETKDSTSEANPTIQTKSFTKKVENVINDEPNASKIVDAKQLTSKQEENSSRNKNAKEPDVENAVAAEAGHKAFVTPPQPADKLKIEYNASSSEPSSCQSEEPHTKSKLHTKQSKNQIEKPLEESIPVEKASESEKDAIKKKENSDQNKMVEVARVEINATEPVKNAEDVLQSGKAATPTRTTPLPSSSNDTKKQQKKAAKIQQQQPIHHHKEEKCKPTESSLPSVELKQHVSLSVESEEPKRDAEVKAVASEPKQSMQQIEEQQTKIDDERIKDKAKLSSPKESKRKKNGRNGKSGEENSPNAPTAKDVELQPSTNFTCITIDDASNVNPPKAAIVQRVDNVAKHNVNENLPKQIEIVPTIEAKAVAKPTQLKMQMPERMNITPPTTPTAITPKEIRQTTAVQDDETSRIWKILEEASKSLEPVEIEMYDGQMPVDQKTIKAADGAVAPRAAVPILQDVSNDCENMEILSSVLRQKNVKEARDAQVKKSNVAAPVVQMDSDSRTVTASTSVKAAETQSRNLAEAKKKPQKAQQNNDKASKSNAQNQRPVEKRASISSETSSADVEIPLDMSIISNTSADDVSSSNMQSPLDDANAHKETVTDSKNVQGSDFVPSVERSSDVAKSLVITVVTQNNKNKNEIENVSAAAVNDQQPAKEKVPQKNEAIAKAKPQSVTAEVKPMIASKPKNVAPKVVSTVATNGGEKSSTEKKPSFPPKPEHLVSSKTKAKSLANATTTPPVANANVKQLISDDDDEEVDYIEYKFMPRQVFICSICQACKASLEANARVLCQSCQMVTYCSMEHMQIDSAGHKELCTAIQEIAKKRGGHIYNNARVVHSNDYRSLRVHTLNICENLLSRPLQTFEREILLFPRLCGTANCREWRQNQLNDCPSCHQVAYCSAHPEHLIENHQRWCKSFQLYEKLVVKQSISGRIEPMLPTKIITKPYALTNNIDDTFKDLYENYAAIKDDCMYATVTQLATAPLTAYFVAQQTDTKIGESFTIHLVGAELQFEADILDIWETFFLHLSHKLVELTIVFCGPELNAENIPLDIISRIRMCRTCRQNCRIVKFDFQCAKLYHDYVNSSSFKKPDLICFFNPGLYRITGFNGLDTWPETIKVATSIACPIVVTSYTEYESPRDLERFQLESNKGGLGKQLTVVQPPQINNFSSQRPERNFISDEVAPLIFKNFYCFILK